MSRLSGIEEARQRIMQYRHSSSDYHSMIIESGISEAENTIIVLSKDDLLLENLELTSEDLQALLPDLCSANVVNLSLSGNKIHSIPDGISEIKTLNQLDISNNSIENLPGTLSELPNLKSLRLDHNPLKEIPNTLFGIKQLESLAMSHCHLSHIAPQISLLAQLRDLNVESNYISDLPADLGKMAVLANLRLQGNPLPSEISQLDPSQQLRYLRELASDHTQVFNEAKLLVVGPGEVGKTFLLQALRGQVPTPGESTKGVEITRDPLEVPYPTDQNRRIQFNCWDFGGQDHYQITHQIFFSPSAIYLLVWKPRPGIDPSLEDRLERIRLSAGKSAKVFIVSTHADEPVPAILGEEALKERFGDLIAGFHAVDSKNGATGTGISKLRDALAQAATSLEGMDTPYPSAWVTAQRAVRALSEPTVTFERLIKICADHEMSDAIQCAKTLASIMNIQGHITYFGDSLNSSSNSNSGIVILRPEWLAKAVSFVLEDEKTRLPPNPGILVHQDLKRIWGEDPHRNCPGYDPELHPYFLWLMWKFDIAYRQDDNTSLLPELILRNRPDGLPWTPLDSNYQDRQVTLICSIRNGNPPLGLVPVMTAAVHPLRRVRTPSPDLDLLDRNWNQGFFLDTAHRGTAFAELVDREFRFTVRHPYPAGLFQLIRGTLAKTIGDRWPNLDCDFMIPCLTKINNRLCEGRFPLAWLAEPTRRTVDCHRCKTDKIPVKYLLEGFDAGGNEARKFIRNEIKRSNKKILKQQDVLLAAATRLHRDLLDPSRPEVLRGPCLLTIIPEDAHWVDLLTKVREARVRVQCWCEHPEGPHRDIPRSSRQTVEAVLRGKRAWVAAIAPYIQWAAGLLQAAVPMVGGVAKLAGDHVTLAHLTKDLTAMADISKALATVAAKAPSATTTRVRGGNRTTRPELTALTRLHDAMLAQWPEVAEGRFGELRPVLTRTNQVLWLCAEHARVHDVPMLTSLN